MSEIENGVAAAQPPTGSKDAVGRVASELIRAAAVGIACAIDGLGDGSDREGVHRIRVSLRRAVALLEGFSAVLPGKRLRRCIGSLDALLGSLGRMRDLDAAIQYLDSLDKSGLSRMHLQGLDRLRLRLCQKLYKRRPAMEADIERFRDSGELDWLFRISDRLGRPGRSEPATSLETLAAAAFEKHLGPLVSYDETLQDEDDTEALHRFRIAVKKARYTLDAFDGLTCIPLESHRARFRRLQDILGTLHDCDVWSVRLDSFRNKEREFTVRFYGTDTPFRRVTPGICFLEDRISRDRKKAFGRLRREWLATRASGFPGILITAMKALAASASACEGGEGDREENRGE